MTPKRAYFGLLGLVGLLVIGIIAGTYEVNQLLVNRSKQLVELKLQSQVVSGQQTSLIRAKQQVKEYSDLERIAASIVPQDKDQAEAVREIANLAAASGISRLSSVTFPLSTLGGVSSSTSSTTTTTTPSAGSKLTQLAPVKGVSGVYSLQITIQQSSADEVPYSRFLTFLARLENNRRTAQVSSIALQPDIKNPSLVAFTLIINEFIKP